MIEQERIQLRGFHNTYDANGNVDGFEFCFASRYYKGLWLSQIRLGNVTVDGEDFDRDGIIYNIYGYDYTREELFDRMDIYWQVNDLMTVKVKKPGGLKQGYHEVDMAFGWVCNYNNDLEQEFDGSGLGNSGFMSGTSNKRRMLLVR